MPTLKRYKTKYPEVFYILGKSKATGKPERIYYIRYRKDGKRIEEKAGRQYQDDMTAARASRIRSDKIEGRRLSNKEKRESERGKRRLSQHRAYAVRRKLVRTRPCACGGER